MSIITKLPTKLLLCLSTTFLSACVTLPSPSKVMADSTAPHPQIAHPQIADTSEPLLPPPVAAVPVPEPPQPVVEEAEAPQLVAEVPEVPPTLNSLWELATQSININFDAGHPRIQAELPRYTKKPAYLGMVSRRAEPFLFHITSELQKYGLPVELLALPVIESAFNPQAVSKHGATGLWQFIASTGKLYGLAKSRWYDGRHDVIASTDAAMRYLQHLRDEFNGDWLLALAAYNAGETTVNRAIERNLKRGRPTDFWNLRLPRETMYYVPRFLGVVSILRNPASFGVELWQAADEPYFIAMTVDERTSLTQLAAGMQIDNGLIQHLNAGFRRGVTPPKTESTLLVPLQFPTTPTALTTSIEPTTVDENSPRHRVRPGETLSYISRLYGVPLEQLKRDNQLSGNHIESGQSLLIPES